MIFVNYRNTVSLKDATSLRIKLEAVLGKGSVFMDKYEIKTGEEWEKKIRSVLEAAKVVLVLINPGWLECPYKDTKPHKGKFWKKGARRLDDPEDWVRQEIELALKDKSKTVHLLLFSGAELPDESDYPEDSILPQLNGRQHYRITDDRADSDLEAFIKEAGLFEKVGLPVVANNPDATALQPAWQDPHADLPAGLPAEPAPFIGLRHFDEANARLFFGRGLETQTLVQQIISQHEARLVLFHGPTGVGKSSLLHAGLFPRLRLRGWVPVYLRRSEVKAEGFHNAFFRVLSEQANAARVVYILDQAEEMFADPVPGEAAAFFDALRNALRERPAAQFLLGFRSDFLDTMLKPLEERGLLETFDFRLHRVEPLNEAGIREAILGVTQHPSLAKHYDFAFEQGLPERLLHDILSDHNPLAHKALLLQIQLRQLWDDARANCPVGHLLIRRELYRKSETLDQLLEVQFEQLKSGWPQQLDNGLALDVLYGFTTPLSTAAVLMNEQVLETYRHIPNFPDFYGALKNTCLLLEQGRFSTRLAHDALAPIIRRRFAESDKPGQRAARILESKKEEIRTYQGTGELFTAGDLQLLELGLKGMRTWTSQEHGAIATCRTYLEYRQAEDVRRREQIVRRGLSDATQQILHLKHAEAFHSITQVLHEEVLTAKLREILLELAFFWAESGKSLDALSVLVRMEELPGDFRIENYEAVNADASVLRDYVRQLAERYGQLTLLEERYYPKMIKVEGGEFKMGDEEWENTRPVHPVELSTFEIAETPLTNWQYGLYCAATGKDIQDTKADWEIEGDNPVVRVSWYDAVAYANWLGQQKGQLPAYKIETDLADPNVLDEKNINWRQATDLENGGYRLPTEAEWEYAVRGGARSAGTKYAGSNDIDEVAWYRKNRTQAVKKLKANELGLYDMSGNVWEWCAYEYTEGYYHLTGNRWMLYPIIKRFNWLKKLVHFISPKNSVNNPLHHSEGSTAVLRGGSWYVDGIICRAARRNWDFRDLRYSYIGVRLARAAPAGGR